MSSKNQTDFSEKQVEHTAKLAHIPVVATETKQLSEAFSTTLEVISDLSEVPVEGVEPTHHVTGLKNVTREDVFDEKRMFSQAQALANAPKSHEGFFVVPRIIDRDEE
jgi:aspartyl-tRNA(Asn)/glutamyl-tRNA(Gln) amidotransferase subunit C